MMKKYLIFFLICFGVSLDAGETQAKKTKVVTITFHGIKEAKGKIQFSLISEKDKEIFPRPGKKENASFQDKTDVKNKGKVTVKTTLPTDQKFAISAYHDLDGNGKFKLVLGFIPKEAYGFSKLKNPPLGEPDFAECSFDPAKVHTVDVYLK